MEKISVQVCTGTTCFVMGGADLQNLCGIISGKYSDKVKVETKNCLGLCSAECGYAKAPYVKVDDDVISEATIEKILESINSKLDNKE